MGEGLRKARAATAATRKKPDGEQVAFGGLVQELFANFTAGEAMTARIAAGQGVESGALATISTTVRFAYGKDGRDYALTLALANDDD